MKYNRNQRRIFYLSAALFALLVLYPPYKGDFYWANQRFETDFGHRFSRCRRCVVNENKFLLETFALAVATGVLAYAARD